MKFGKIIALTTASLMLALSLVSCGGQQVADVNVNVKAVADGATLLETTVAVSGDANILDAIEAACEAKELDITFNDGEEDVKSIGDYDTYENEDGEYLFWLFKINGQEVEGTAIDNIVSEGMNIEYLYTTAKSRYVTFKLVADGETIIEEQVLEGLLVNVLEQAAAIELSEDGTVEDIGDYEAYENDDETAYWVYRLNGKKVAEYNANEDEIDGGSVVEFTYIVE